MTNTSKWTLRNIEPEALALLHEVSETSGLPMGALVSQALVEWYDRLPEIDDDEPASFMPVAVDRPERHR